MPISRRELLTGAAAGAGGLVIGGVTGAVIGGGGDDNGGAGAATGLGGQADSVVKARSLKPEDVTRALKTFVPPGETTDEFFLFASGGHSGQILVIGVPSMRLLKVIAVFSPEPWQGHGYGADSSDLIIKAGTDSKNKPASAARGPLTWGDTHHPALSETKGEYDGRWIYINDRANGRIAMVDLRDFKTKQIIDVPNLDSSHGGVFCTPNSEYVHISTMSPTLLDPSKAANALDNFKDNFRGFSSFMAIDQKTGRMDLSRSFQIELPPYTQDLADSGKLVSDGWVFINSYNSEMATGGNLDGGKPIEVGASANDFDFLHIINWKKAEQIVGTKSKVINGMRVIPLETAVAEGILYLAPEPKSPHGVDVAPNGQYISVGGKLDPHVTIYSIDKILNAIKNNEIEKKDQYGIPVLKLDSVVAGRVEVGLGPLHTQYDAEGHGYISLFLDSAVAKFTLGEPYFKGDQAFKLVDKLPVQYNIGHLVTMEGDTVKPAGKYLVALNKWSIDRFPVVGTLKPQNFQLVDLTGEKMEVLSDMPIGIGEPHYTQGIRADRIKAWEVYPVGTNPLTMEKDPNATAKGAEKVSRTADGVEVWGTVTRSQFKPDNIRARKGDKVVLHLTNIETTPDATHGFSIPRYNVNVSLDPGEAVTIEFVADAVGTFAYYCTEFCSALHLEMQGWLIVS
ncbi:MAG TPA: Sec-dependent nitrous-oxide reductase [Tepidiformaceae bacterium]|nr:Sec-dependent nitrous-oxide reductase [Thermoflexaceae bacterium]HMS58123.1 Sec-dependent nitrous-oxide reductase [Tepidiformaceae bacterium]